MGDMPEFETFTAHDLRWVAEKGFAPIVRRDKRVVSPARDSRIIKAGPARRVWRFMPEGSDTAVYAKENLLPDLTDRIRYLCRPSKAWSEWQRLEKLKQQSVPVPRPLAVGVKRRGPLLQTSVIITEEIPGVAPLVEYLCGRAAEASHSEVSAFTAALAAFIRRLHDAGVVHHDFHPANIMVSGPPEMPAFYLLDVHEVCVRSAPSRRARLRNLAVLGHFFCRTVPRHWRLRFLAAYLGFGRAPRTEAREVERCAESGMRKIWSGRDKRIFSENKYFRHVRIGGLLGHRRVGAMAEAAVRLFEEGRVFEKPEVTLKDSRSSMVGVFRGEAAGQEVSLLVKRYNARGALKCRGDLFRLSRGKRGFYFAAAFELRHLPTPRVYAALDDRRWDRLCSSYVVMEYIQGAENLAAVLAARESHFHRRLRAEGAAFAERLARTIRRMHWCGFSMRDLKAANILVYEENDRLEHALIDLDGVRQYTHAAGRLQAMRNLARLYFDVSWLGVPRRLSMHFLKTYLGPVTRAELRIWASGIARLARAKRRRFTPKGVFGDGGAATIISMEERDNG